MKYNLQGIFNAGGWYTPIAKDVGNVLTLQDGLRALVGQTPYPGQDGTLCAVVIQYINDESGERIDTFAFENSDPNLFHPNSVVRILENDTYKVNASEVKYTTFNITPEKNRDLFDHYYNQWAKAGLVP